MGINSSKKCPVCRDKQATYKYCFYAEGYWHGRPSESLKNINIEEYNFEMKKWKLPPFEKRLGPDCLKYIEKLDPEYIIDPSNYSCICELTDEDVTYSWWAFYSCENCIDTERKKIFINSFR